MVAFSFAGEQRGLVLPVAQELESILGESSVFYDEWFEFLIAGADGDLELQKIYSAGAELVVVCVSGEYGSKGWPKAEHRAIRSLLIEAPSLEASRRVLPLRVGDGDVEGVLSNEIVPDLRKKSIAEAAELIIGRLNLVRQPAQSASHGVDWPDAPPALKWPMADHRDARTAFETLLTRSSPQRALLIQGPTGTGKTHISMQMLRGAMAMTGLSCGRFDFKGTTGMDIEVDAFAQSLDAELPEGQGLNERLGKIFVELRRRAQPTLLIFDAYEAAGEAKNWLERLVLQHVTSAKWLRIVVIGQSVPIRLGATWESVAAGPITLKPPDPDDWLEFGRENRGESVTRDFVTQVHEATAGNASVLYQVLGPRV